MTKTHYQVLDVESTSTASEIRSAYRKLVMLHHPDRSSDPKSKAIFFAATEAYEILNDPQRRKDYDDRLAIEGKLRERMESRAARAPNPPRKTSTPTAKVAELKLDLNRLNMLYSRGNFAEAEKLARSVLERDQRQPVPYAVLGDIARMSGRKNEAIKMYAYAVQYDPRNPVYQQRYDDLADSPAAYVQVARGMAQKADEKPRNSLGLAFGFGLVFLACVYIFFSPERQAMTAISLISTWTIGLVAMLFFSGVAMGCSLAFDGLLDNFNSVGRVGPGRTSPTVALATIAIVSFWAALAMYLLIGWRRKTFNISTSRIMASCVVSVCLLAFASEASGAVSISGGISGLQVFLWGGNLVYLGSLCGWMVTDALKIPGG